VVKRKFHAVLRFHKVPKVRTVKGFSGLSYFLGCNRPTRSQSRRAVNCATSRNRIVSYPCGILGFAASCGARNHLLAFTSRDFDRYAILASLTRPQDALRRRCPKQVRYQLRHISMNAVYSVVGNLFTTVLFYAKCVVLSTANPHSYYFRDEKFLATNGGVGVY